MSSCYELDVFRCFAAKKSCFVISIKISQYLATNLLLVRISKQKLMNIFNIFLLLLMLCQQIPKTSSVIIIWRVIYFKSFALLLSQTFFVSLTWQSDETSLLLLVQFFSNLKIWKFYFFKEQKQNCVTFQICYSRQSNSFFFVWNSFDFWQTFLKLLFWVH